MQPDMLHAKPLPCFAPPRAKGDPRAMLRAINPREAALLDAAAGAHVRFRLGGSSFPPVVLYKIFTHRPVVGEIMGCSEAEMGRRPDICAVRGILEEAGATKHGAMQLSSRCSVPQDTKSWWSGLLAAGGSFIGGSLLHGKHPRCAELHACLPTTHVVSMIIQPLTVLLRRHQRLCSSRLRL